MKRCKPSWRFNLWLSFCCSVLCGVWCAQADAQGFQATYYSSTGFGDAIATRVDPSIDFNWSEAQRPPGMPSTNFTVRWQGQINPRYSEPYKLIVLTDDGLRLWVDGQLLIDAWRGQGATSYQGEITLRADEPVSVMVEYFQGSGPGVARLEWESPSQVREVITSDRITPEDLLLGPQEVSLFTTRGGVVGERSQEQGRFVVTRRGALDEALTVRLEYETDAVPGEDFAPLPQEVTIAARRTSVDILVSVLDDAVAEEEEFVSAMLVEDDGYAIGAPREGTVVITDDDQVGLPDSFSIVGSLEHGGTSAAHLVAVVYSDDARTEEVDRAALVSPGVYSVGGLPPGRYLVTAFLDEDFDGELDADEPSLDAPPVELPPDALNIDFDFTPDCDVPDPPPECGEVAEDVGVGGDVGEGHDAGHDADPGDGLDAGGDDADDEQEEVPGPSRGPGGGDGGCQQPVQGTRGVPWALLSSGLGAWLLWRRRRTLRGEHRV